MRKTTGFGPHSVTSHWRVMIDAASQESEGELGVNSTTRHL